MISSIQLKKETKDKLTKLKAKHSESYETVIERLIEKEFFLREELIEGYRASHKENEEIEEEFKYADSSWR
jgi:hypothetical protein